MIKPKIAIVVSGTQSALLPRTLAPLSRPLFKLALFFISSGTLFSTKSSRTNWFEMVDSHFNISLSFIMTKNRVAAKGKYGLCQYC